MSYWFDGLTSARHLTEGQKYKGGSFYRSTEGTFATGNKPLPSELNSLLTKKLIAANLKNLCLEMLI